MKLLAFDTSTQVLSVAVGDGRGAALAQYRGEGGAQASYTLIAQVQALLAQLGWSMGELDAIVFGAGPGSFTGLRTACAVAQGLALGADCPVLPVSTLLAVAETARLQVAPAAASWSVAAVLDARMQEVYARVWDWSQSRWSARDADRLCAPSDLEWPADVKWLAGNAPAVYATELAPWLAQPQHHSVQALPQAEAMLRLAPQLLAQGLAVAPEQALPVYVRDKVAQTSAERAALKTGRP